MGKFVIRKTATGVKFDLRAGNGEIIATSEVYETEAACLKGIESVRKNAEKAKTSSAFYSIQMSYFVKLIFSQRLY